jgi:RHS repeat-associated protein
LRHDPRVAFVQQVGALAEDARVQTPVARQTKSSPVPRPVTPASVGLTKWEYEYDGSGNVARINGSESSSAYAYDLMNRLTTATVGSAQQTYTYDAFGNRTSKAEGTDTTTFGVDPATNRLMRQTVNGTVAWTLEYDEAGHVKKDRAGHAYQFDAAGMMNHMTTTTARNRRMIYTAGDERIAVIDTFSGGKETEFTVRDFAGRVLRVWYQTDGMPLWQRDYVYADGGLIAEVRNVDAAEDPVHHFHADHLGSIRLTTAGTSGVLTRSHEFWPFGEEITSTVQESFERVQPMKFTGHERDYISAVNNESTDYLDYMHARYYAPTVGRFLSPDPLLGNVAAPQSLNRYAYTMNSPVSYTDPQGLFSWKPWDWFRRRSDEHRAEPNSDAVCHDQGCTITVVGKDPDPIKPRYSPTRVLQRPDYWTYTVGGEWYVGGAAHVSLDRWGRLYGGIGPTAGTPGAIHSFALGRLDRDKPTKEDVANLLSAGAWDASAGHTVGIGRAYSGDVLLGFTGRSAATEIGATTPGATLGWSYSWGPFQLPGTYDAEHPYPLIIGTGSK